MKPEQKNKRRGRSPSPKKKLKRKYRNDRSKKAQSSSETSSTEEASLTSDEYPSSGEERRKEAKKKRSKKTKHKSRASVSTSPSPSPEKVKKKSKSRDDGSAKKEKYKKERKASPSPKKKRRQSSDSIGSSDDDSHGPVKKEKTKKRRSPSPVVKMKKKKSVSPVAEKGSGRSEKKKKSLSPSPSPVKSKKQRSPSPVKSKKQRSPSPVKNKKQRSPSPVKNKKQRSPSPAKNKKQRSPSPVRNKKQRSPLRQMMNRSPSPARTSKKSPPRGKHDRGSQSPPPRSRKRSSTPPMKEKKMTPDSRMSGSPVKNKPKKPVQIPDLTLDSPTVNAPKKESKNSARKLERESPGSDNVERKKVHGPMLPALPPSMLSPSSPPVKTSTHSKSKNGTGDSKRNESPIGEGKRKSASSVEEVTKARASPTEEVKKRMLAPTSGKGEKKAATQVSTKVMESKTPIVSTKSEKEELEKKVLELEKKVVSSNATRERERKDMALMLSREGEKKMASPVSNKDVQQKVPAPVQTKGGEKKVQSPMYPKGDVKKVQSPMYPKGEEKKVQSPMYPRGEEKKVQSPMYSKGEEKKVQSPMYPKGDEKKVPAPIYTKAEVQAPMCPKEEDKKMQNPMYPKEEGKKMPAPMYSKGDEKIVQAPMHPKGDEKKVQSPLYPKEIPKKVAAPIPAKEVEKKVTPPPSVQGKSKSTIEEVESVAKDVATKGVTPLSAKEGEKQISAEGDEKSKTSVSEKYIAVSTPSTSTGKISPASDKITMSSVSDKPPVDKTEGHEISSPLVKTSNELKANPVSVKSIPVTSAGVTSTVIKGVGVLGAGSNMTIKSSLVIKKKINVLSSKNVMDVKKEDDATKVKEEDTAVVSGNKKNSSPLPSRPRKRSPSPVRSRKRSSVSPIRNRKRSKSPSPRSRKRSKSPPRRKRSRSRTPPARYRRDDKSRRRSRSRSSSPLRIKRERDRSPDKDSKKRKGEVKRKDDEWSGDKKDRDDKDRRRNRDEKDRGRKKDEKDVKGSKRDKSPEKKDITELEDEMKKRKERIEAWRNANRKKDGDTAEGEASVGPGGETVKVEKKWSLEDDDSEDEENGTDNKGDENSSSKKGGGKNTSIKKESKEKTKEEAADDVDDDDPLESFMKSINSEVNKLSGGNTAIPTSTTGTKTKTITVVKTVTVVNKPVEVKPEVMEQNQDALEYSSEEEETADITASDFTDATKKRKELTVADHTKIYYAPFRRDFYVEVPELARMNADEVKFLREALGDIQVRGKNIPKPIKSWAQAGLSAKVMNVLKRCAYEKPTPVQAQALPVAMSGRDMIGIAKTGSGKTLAFVLPMLRHVLDQPALDEDDGPIAIIMTPTRELALQIYRESKKFCKVLGLNVTCIYGGSGISEQISELKKGTEIIVCTPGRMIDMLAANNGRVTNCRRCTFLVMDEADRMFDMGFEPQVMKIIGNIRPDRQTVLFSATFPRQMEAVARKVLTKPIEIQVGGRSIVCSDVEQHAIVIEEDNKFFKVLELLGVYQEQGSILLFVERQETADTLFKDLLKKGYPCLSLHGGMDQFDRDSTIADFKNSVTKLMVSTSVAARGLDVKNLNLVVNYDCPNHYEDYVHRVGRTGRAGNKGTSFTFITTEQGRSAGDVIKAFELSKLEPPEDVVALWNAFKEDMEKEGKTIKMNSGFSGTKGFKFNAEEDAMVNESKKMRKFTLGLQDSDEEAEAADDALEKIEADLEKAFSSKPKIALQPEVLEGQKVKIAEQNVDKDKLKQASSIAALINKKLSSGQVIDRNTAATAHIMQGGALESLTGVGLAKQLADKVNAKLNYKAAEVENQVEEKPIAVRYEEEIDINDFPQQARWRITSKEIIEQVRELSEAGVTVRGLYIPPNKAPTAEERRLHLYIESLSERSIQIAKAEIKRLLKEELLKSEANSYRPAQQTGRYKVL